MIDFQTLVLTLGLLLCIVALTTAAAVANKIHSNQEEDSKRKFLDKLRKRLLLLKTPRGRLEAMPGIVAAMTGRWSELAAEEISQLELPIRLDVLRALERAGVISRCIRGARSRLKWTRAHAIRMLGELRMPQCVPTLLHALEDADADVRIVAARSLGRMKLEAAEEALVALLGKPDQAVSARIAAIFIEMGPCAVPPLIRALREGPPRGRFWSARILGEIHDPRATRSLGEALLDPDPEVRSAATWALGRMGDRTTAFLAEPLLRDPVWFVRAHAAEALGRIGDAAVAPVLGEALRDRSWWVRRNALDALVRIGELAKPALLKSLECDDRFARECAAEGLTSLGTSAAAPSREGD